MVYALVHYAIFKVDLFETRKELIDYLLAHPKLYDIIDHPEMEQFLEGKKDLEYGNGVISLARNEVFGWIAKAEFKNEVKNEK